MKKIISLLLALALCLSLVACGSKEPPLTPEEKKQLALDTLAAHVMENGVDGGSGNKVIVVDTSIKDVTSAFWCNSNELYFKLDYSPSLLNTKDLSTQYSTVLYFYGAPPQKENQYFILQWNAINGINLYAYVDIDPSIFTGNGELAFSDVIRADGKSIDPNEQIIKLTRDGINVILEVLSEYLKESIGFTLSDFGFTAYQIIENRESDIRNSK